MKKYYIIRPAKNRILPIFCLFFSFILFTHAQPTISCVPGFTITCETDVIVNVDAPFVFSNCNIPDGAVTVTGPVLDGPLGCPGSTYTYTYTVVDDCGESASCDQVFTVGNQVGPSIISCPPNQVAACSFNVFPQPHLVEVQTPCGLATDIEVVGPQVFGPAECNGTQYIYTYIASDLCGRTAQCQQVYTLSNEGSEFICPPAICVLDCPADGDLIAQKFDAFATQATIVNPCGNESTVTNNFSPNNFINTNCGNGPIAYENATQYQIVTFTAVDACFGFTNCTAVVVVVDNEPPVITGTPQLGITECNDHAQANYDSWIQLNLNNLSATDECSNVTWSYTPNSPTEVCDVNGFAITEVLFTASDDCGNTTTVEANYLLENNSPPEFVDLVPTIEINCGENANFIEPTVQNACGNTTVTFVDSTLPGDCDGESISVRTYTVTDDCGATNTASQTISTIDNVPPVFDNVPPTGMVGCGESVNFVEPTATDQCSGSVTITFVEYTVGNDCVNGQQINRDWTATDACGNESTVTTSVILEGDTSPPVFTFVPETPDVDCGNIPEFEEPVAADDCGAVTLTFVEYQSPGTICDNGYSLKRDWTAMDNCGNATTVTTAIWVNADVTPPIFTFVPETPDVGCNNIPEFETPIAVDDCGNVTITFVEYQSPPDGVICEDGISAKRDWTATDDCGNATTVTTAIWINEYETNVTTATVSGIITNIADEMIDEVSVMVEGSSTAGMIGALTTDETGVYNFDLEPGQNYTIAPARNTDVLNGLSTMDLILLGQHLLEVQPLDTPYKIIAADINNSGTVSSLDMIALRRLILRIDEDLNNNTSWRFVEADYIFNNPTNPFISTFPEIANINGLTGDIQQDFIGIKVGDLNGNAIPNALVSGDTRTERSTQHLMAKDIRIEKGDTKTIEVKAKDFTALLGYQMTLEFDPAKLEIMEIIPVALRGLNEENFGTQNKEAGIITTSWNTAHGLSLEDETVLFKIVIKAKEILTLSEVLQSSSSLTTAEAYSEIHGLMNADLLFEEVKGFEKDRFALFQNYPNPFEVNTKIGFYLDKTGETTLTIYDMDGKIRYTESGNYENGYHEITLGAAELGEAGMLYYHLNTTDRKPQIKKMVWIKL